MRAEDLGLGKLFGRVRDAVIVAEAKTERIVLWNPAATDVFGYSIAEALEMRIEALVPGYLKAPQRTGMARYGETSRGRYIDSHTLLDLPAVRKDGEEIRIEVSLSSVELVDGAENGDGRFVLAIVRDVTERKRFGEDLRRNEERFRAVVQNASDIITILEADGTVRYESPAIERVLGYRPDELVGKNAFSYVHPDDLEKATGALAEAVKSGGSTTVEFRFSRKDGSWCCLEAVGSSLLEDPNVRGIVVNSRDVTERKRSEEALRRSFDSLLALYEAGRVLGSSLERDGIGSRLLEITKRVSGLEAAAIDLCDEQGQGSEWRSVGSEEVLAAVREQPEVVRSAVDEVSKGGRARTTELSMEPHRKPNTQAARSLTGVFVPLRVRGRVIGVLEGYGSRALAEKDAMETLSSLASQSASALENARLYEELAERERELQNLVGRMAAAQEEERRRVAYEVHDGFTQTAASAYRRLALFAEHRLPESAQDREELEEIVALVKRTVGEARRVIANLRPTALDDFGLAAAIRLQAQELRDEGHETSYEETLGEERLPAALETVLFRVAQEALNNVRKHAGTEQVCIALGRRNGIVRLEVRDWGRGFSPAEMEQGAGPGARVGLSIMRERISLLGGSLDIRSAPGTGTSVMAEVPMSATQEGADGEK